MRIREAPLFGTTLKMIGKFARLPSTFKFDTICHLRFYSRFNFRSATKSAVICFASFFNFSFAMRVSAKSAVVSIYCPRISLLAFRSIITSSPSFAISALFRDAIVWMPVSASNPLLTMAKSESPKKRTMFSAREIKKIVVKRIVLMFQMTRQINLITHLLLSRYSFRTLYIRLNFQRIIQCPHQKKRK